MKEQEPKGVRITMKVVVEVLKEPGYKERDTGSSRKELRKIHETI